MRAPVVVAALVVLFSGCLGTTRYRIATFLFDGVPPKSAGEAPPVPDAPRRDKASEAPVLPVVPVLYKHRPYEQGSCRSCHDARASNALVREGNGLCLGCHAQTMAGKKNVHVPAQAACLICHTPHKSETRALLLVAPPDLCLQCHARDQVEKKHGGVFECLKCHNPHESDSDKLLEFK